MESITERRTRFERILARIGWMCASHNGAFRFWPGLQRRDYHEGNGEFTCGTFKEAEAFVAGLDAMRGAYLAKIKPIQEEAHKLDPGDPGAVGELRVKIWAL